MATTEIAVPDIGDYQDVPVIEVHVAAGDVVAEEDPPVSYTHLTLPTTPYV